MIDSGWKSNGTWRLKGLGLITIREKVRGSRRTNFSIRPFVSSTIRPQLIKVVGDDVSVAIALLHYANNMLRGGYSTTTSSTHNLMERMKALAIRLLHGDSIQEAMRNDDEDIGAHEFRRRQAIVYARLAESATVTFSIELMFGGALERRLSGSQEPFWDGIREFVPSAEIGRALNVAGHRRSYMCIVKDNCAEMIVLATLHGPQLYAFLLVKRYGESIKNGEVLTRVCNVQLSNGYVRLSRAEWIENQPLVYQTLKRLLEGSGVFYRTDDMHDMFSSSSQNDSPLRVTTLLYDKVEW